MSKKKPWEKCGWKKWIEETFDRKRRRALQWVARLYPKGTVVILRFPEQHKKKVVSDPKCKQKSYLEFDCPHEFGFLDGIACTVIGYKLDQVTRRKKEWCVSVVSEGGFERVGRDVLLVEPGCLWRIDPDPEEEAEPEKQAVLGVVS